jgi:hypothetical protein
MVLDMTYEEVAMLVPLQKLEELRETGINRLGLEAFDCLPELAKSKALYFGDVLKPFECRTGSRYLFALTTDDPLMCHCVVVDETGLAFDPADISSRKHWSEYDPKGVLEFRPLSGRDFSWEQGNPMST